MDVDEQELADLVVPAVIARLMQARAAGLPGLLSIKKTFI